MYAHKIADSISRIILESLINPGTDREKRLPALFADYILQEGDVVREERPGGGGFGDPLDREAEKVRRDVLEGYVSVESARNTYGKEGQIGAILAPYWKKHVAILAP